jgi:hypothetical protein
MSTIGNLTTRQAAQHLAGFEQSISLDQRVARLKVAALAAKAAGDTATLVALKAQWQALRPAFAAGA